MGAGHAWRSTKDAASAKSRDVVICVWKNLRTWCGGKQPLNLIWAVVTFELIC